MNCPQAPFVAIPGCPGHPGAAAGTRVSTLKQEVSDKSGLLCGTQGLSPPFERNLGARHRSLLSQHLGGWAAPRRGQPGCRQPGALPCLPRAGLHVMGMCRAFAPSLFFIHVGWKNVFMRRVAVALCHGPSAWALFSPADELNLSIGLCWLGRKSGVSYLFLLQGRKERTHLPLSPAPAPVQGSSSAIYLIIPNPGGSDSKV